MKKIILICLVALSLSAQFNFSFKDLEKYGTLPEKHITVIVPMYKNHDYVEFCLGGLFLQNFENCNFIIIDDASPDDTLELINECVKKYNKESCTKVIANKARQGALANIYYAVWSCADTDIIVTVDGDDRLADNNVLKKVNAAYAWSEDVWLTHGYFLEYPDDISNWSESIPVHVVKNNTHRKHSPHPSHLRTFYAKLFKLIQKKDLLYNNKFFEMSWDQAMMFPMIEMAAERHYYFSKDTVLYLYNRITPLNDNKVNAKLQRQLEKIIRAKKPYRRIKSLWDCETESYRRQAQEQMERV